MEESHQTLKFHGKELGMPGLAKRIVSSDFNFLNAKTSVTVTCSQFYTELKPLQELILVLRATKPARQ